MPTPIIVPKASALMNPDQLATLATAGQAGVGITFTAKRYGYGPPTTPPNKASSAKPMFAVAGAEGAGAQSADAGVATVFPSQYCFPTTKYRNEARLKGT